MKSAIEFDPHKPTLRVLQILETLAQHSEGCTLTELSRLIGASKSTLVPVLKTMEQRHFIVLDKGTSKYILGIKMFSLGAAFTESESAFSLIRNQMEQLVNNCMETCQLGILDGTDVFYITKIDSPEPIRLISSSGKRIPAYCTALGKALLCDFNRAQLDELYPYSLTQMTAHTIENLDQLAHVLEQQKETGIFTEYEESTENVACFAVPLRKNNKIAAAVSISLPLFRLNKEKEIAIRKSLQDFQKKTEQLLSSFNSEDAFLW